MNRRELFRGIVGVGAGLVLPATVVDAAEEVSKRYWSLGEVPRADQIIDMWEQDFIEVEVPAADWMYSAWRVGSQASIWSQDGTAIIEWATVTGVSAPHPVIVARNDV